MPNRVRMSRKMGIEMEGYFNQYPRNIHIRGATIKKDVSLYNPRWAPSDRYGVEVVSRPVKSLNIFTRIITDMQEYGWSTDNRAGTHVHIDISDFDEYDKVKLIRFCKGIERIIFMFVRDYRRENRFCHNLGTQWRKIFRNVSGERNYRYVDWSLLESGLSALYVLRRSGYELSNGKYNWCNIYGSNRPTVEFRLFHAIENVEEPAMFARFAHHIVDTVKNSTVEQLEFLILSLFESENSEQCARNLFYAIGLDYDTHGLPIKGLRAREYLENKLRDKHRKREEEAQRMSEMELVISA